MKRIIAIIAVLAVLAAGIYYSLPTLVPAIEKLTESLTSQGQTASKPETTAGRRKKAAPTTEADIGEAIAGEMAKNKDTVGWLSIPGTTIDDPVLQSNNNAYYLRLNEDKEPDIYGCYFADYENSIGTGEEMSPTTVIYGHSDLKDNPSGIRFSQLFKFTDQEFAAKTPYVKFSSPEENMIWEIFAVSYVDAELPYIEKIADDAQMTQLIKDIKSSSIYDYKVEVGVKDKILILSTCTIKFGSSQEHRLIISAKLLPPGEEVVENARIVQINDNF